MSFTDASGYSRERADLEDMMVAPDGRILLAGQALFDTTGDNYDFALARLDNAAIFMDGFETAGPGRWSNSIP